MADLNALTKDVLENKAKLRELELRIEAIILALEAEDMLTRDDVEIKLKELMAGIKK